MSANPYRGEAPLKIGPVDLVIAVEFGGLAKFSGMTGLDDAGSVMKALIGFSPARARAALECFTVSGDWQEAAKHLSMAVAGAWREAFTQALADHLEKATPAKADGANGGADSPKN